MVQPDGPQMTIWRMRIAFPRQHWLHDCASVLSYTYIACPVEFTILKIFC